MDYKLEVVIIPVTDVDRAKDFYLQQAGFRLDVDHRAGEDFRVVQLTPPGSACSVTLMRNPESAGQVQGLHLVVSDIDAARADLGGRGVGVSEPFHFGPSGPTPGHHPGGRTTERSCPSAIRTATASSCRRSGETRRRNDCWRAGRGKPASGSGCWRGRECVR